MEIIFKIPRKQHQEELINLDYGTVVTDIDSNPKSIYIKVSKDFGSGISPLSWTKGKCILLNLVLGTLRVVDRTMIVTVLDAQITLTPTLNINLYQRTYMPRRSK